MCAALSVRARQPIIISLCTDCMQASQSSCRSLFTRCGWRVSPSNADADHIPDCDRNSTIWRVATLSKQALVRRVISCRGSGFGSFLEQRRLPSFEIRELATVLFGKGKTMTFSSTGYHRSLCRFSTHSNILWLSRRSRTRGAAQRSVATLKS